MKLHMALICAMLLASCAGGGGRGATSTVTPPPTTVTLAAMVGSLGRAVPEREFAGRDAAAAGADGSAGD